MNISFFVTTYNIHNLHISLPAIQRYVRTHPRTDAVYTLCINNDNPKYSVSRPYLEDIIDLKIFDNVAVRNTDKNQGCLNARLSTIRFAEILCPDWFMFIDDDDVILDPTFDCDDAQVFNLSHRAVVTHRLLEVLQLIDGKPVDLNNQYIEYEEWKMGCVGIPYRYEPYRKFINALEGFLPELYQIYGTDHVMEPDDCILMNLWNVWLQFVIGPEWLRSFKKCDRFAYSLTYLEDRVGRYEIAEGVIDLRYGKRWDGVTTYEKIYNTLNGAFDAYLHRRG